jgi:uncharacterized protein YdhG (YjbR/CyaY superfamily)
MKKVTTVEEYIASFPKDTQKMLKQMRVIIKKSAPKADEVLSYHMPAYKYHGMVAYFAGHTNHVGLYPMPSAVGKFKKELMKYKTSKSTAQFPIGKPLPVALITKIIKFRVKENLAKMQTKKVTK